MTRTARCECGQLSITVPEAPRGVGLCHCLACQRRTGSVFAALASFEPPWSATGEATRHERVGDREGSRFTFHFCPVCGTTLFHTEAGSERVSVAVGAFGDRDFPAPTTSIYDCRRHPWVTLPEVVVAFPHDPE